MTFAPEQVYVLGEVRNSKAIKLVPGMTIIQALAVVKHTPVTARALEVMGKKSGMTSPARAAAAWALGLLLEGSADAKAAAPLAGRLTDAPVNGPAEEPLVRRMAAVSLGRMSVPAVAATLEKTMNAGETPDEVAAACHWALEQIAGPTTPPLEPRRVRQRGWFLEY